MVKRIGSVLLCLGLVACRTSHIDPNAPVNFRSNKQASFPAYDEVFTKAYRRVGSRNPKWDPDAEKAIKLWSYNECDEDCVVAGPEFEPMVAAFRGALTNGCDDPMVLYMGVRLDEIKGRIHFSTRKLIQQNPHDTYARIMEGLKSHPYPAIEQILIHVRGVQDTMSLSAGDSVSTLQQNRSNWLEQAISLAAEVDFNKTDPGQYRGNFEKLCGILWIGGNRKNGEVSKRHYDELEAALRKNKTCSEAIFLTIKGLFYSDWAWEARGSGFSDSVTEEGAKLFNERLLVAQPCLEQAWALDRSNEYICKQLVKASGAQQDMNALEIWFQRGKKIDPDDEQLYIAKLTYLQPRWFGSSEDMLQFGRECLKEGRWDSRIPFVLLSAHYWAAGDTVEDRRSYFAQPEVWKEIEPLFTTYLARYPSNYMRLSSYINYAASAGKWDLVSKLMHDHGWDVIFLALEDQEYTSYSKILSFQDHSKVPAYLK